MVELLRNILAERVASTSGRNAPAAAVIGIGPEQIADGTFVGNLLNTVELADLVEGVDRWRETSVETEDLSLNNSGQWKVVEELSESFPHIRISVLSQTLIVEAVTI